MTPKQRAEERLDGLRTQWKGSHSLGAAQALINGLEYEYAALLAQQAEHEAEARAYEMAAKEVPMYCRGCGAEAAIRALFPRSERY